MPNRPFIQKSIAELETMFASGPGDAALRRNLLHELAFRSTKRAKNLERKVREAGEGSAKRAPRKVAPKPPEPATTIRFPTPDPTPAPTAAPPGVSEAMQPFRYADPGPKPPIRNRPQDILKAWTALEALSPLPVRRPSDLALGPNKSLLRLDQGPLPWAGDVKGAPGKKVVFEVVLGAMELEPAFEALLRTYADDRPDPPSRAGVSPIATVLLDKTGAPFEDPSCYAISSFAWGVPIALRGDLEPLARWPQAERDLKAGFAKQLIQRNPDGEILPLTRRDIDRLYAYLVDALQLAGCGISPPAHVVKRFEYFASKTPPEPSLLNSFFLEDLAEAADMAAAGRLPLALSHYLGERCPGRRMDLLKNDEALRELLRPSATPAGRWPGRGRHPLALLQQAAVNATSEGMEETGVLGVNGPPGTGKTTLLRDVVAARIVERARVMAGFDDPAQAFADSGEFVTKDGARIRISTLDKRLKGWEMVVASSNNKAVENVSRELPGADAVAADAEGLRYFKSISDNVLGADTWGLVSAVLGNSANRFEFSQRFWRDEENGMAACLNHAAGVPQMVAERGTDGTLTERLRSVVQAETPPGGRREAQNRWTEARRRFVAALARAEATSRKLDDGHERILSLGKLQGKLAKQERRTQELSAEIAAAKTDRAEAAQKAETSQATARKVSEAANAHRERRPGVFARLFATSAARAWKQTMARHLSAAAAATTASRNAADALDAKNKALEDSEGEHQKLVADIGRNLAACDRLTKDVDALREAVNAETPDDRFFRGGHGEKQTASLWFDMAAQQERDEVFVAAMQLHRAFVEASADAIRQNLEIFTRAFGTASFGNPKKDALIPDLWGTFFLVVPVVSTTFASVRRMFARLPLEGIGWLLVDEAGQALPQAAVGAIMRARRAVVVGDPLQIEPVVTMPGALTQEICARFGINPLMFNAPDASVQTLADRASIFRTEFLTGSGSREVGLPLLVHRRCDSPMFDISNRIAYAGQMVQAKPASTVARPLGPSSWMHVEGEAGPDKWCEAEADALIRALRALRRAGGEPDIYVISPFVIVQENLRRRLLADGVLHGWVERPKDWVYERVGTVHTVQGREAKTVFFVLGAQASSQRRARAWASSRPNLVNVAVTRSQQSLYVIGNRVLWSADGNVRIVSDLLPAAEKI